MTPEENAKMWQRILDIEASIETLKKQLESSKFQDSENERHIKINHDKIKEIGEALDKIEEDVKEEETNNLVGATQLPKKLSFWDKVLDKFPFGVE